MPDRKIIHIDMDCFYAAVEMLEHPELRKVPLAIGGTGRRAVLCTSNYEARKYGVRAAMPTAIAFKKCPNLIVRPVNGKKVMEASRKIREIFHRFTDLVEPLSLDEAFLDVTECEEFQGSATLIAKRIKELILEETGLTASAGVAPNKFLAKIASDWKKPDGLFVIPPSEVANFVKGLSVSKIFGVGKVTYEKMQRLGIETCADVQSWDPNDLRLHFGKFGPTLFQMAQGIDERPVDPTHIRKSLSVEETYAYDLENIDQCLDKIPRLLEELLRRLKKWKEKEDSPLPMSKFFVKMRFSDFKAVTVEKKQEESFFHNLYENLESSKDLEDLAETLFITAFERRNMPVRLLGLGVRFKDLEDDEMIQLSLFDKGL